MKKLYIFLLAGVIATASSCTYTFPENEVPTSGTADFTKVVAVGNSLTAGLMNAALYDEGQQASYANIVAQQIKLVGGGDFKQPDINSENGVILSYLPGALVGRLILQFQITTEGPTSPAPAPIGVGEYPMSTYSGDLNNFGVPGMRIVEAGLDGYGALNPYFGRFASTPATSVLKDAMAADGSFILFWLGSNDALGYATGGATGSIDGDGTNPNDMTALPVFEFAYNAVLGALTAEKKGIVANIPNIGDIPHFTTVSWNAIEFDPDDPASEPTIEALNTAFLGLNGVLDALKNPAFGLDPNDLDSRKVEYALGPNPILIQDDNLVDLGPFFDILVGMGAITPAQRAGLEPYRKSRPMTEFELVTLSAGAVLGKDAFPIPTPTPIGVAIPLDEKYTLNEQNQSDIVDRIKAYNAYISSEVDASEGNLVLLDINAIFAEFALKGVVINGAGLDASITPPLGGFSLDGIHPNPRGAAYVASLFIDRINEAFGANIPNVNPNEYPGNELPQLTP